MKDFKYEIIKHVATLSDNRNGSTLQANVISYNDGDPKFDLRRWKDDVMYKGVAMSDEEAENLYEALKEWLGEMTAKLLALNDILYFIDEGEGTICLDIKAEDPWNADTIVEVGSGDGEFYTYYRGVGVIAWRDIGNTDTRDYGITWRCWDQRPSDDIRKNTPWKCQ